jgi:hypothetical protein
VRRGSIDFDLPEPLIEFDEWGAMTGVTRAPRNIAHRIIEEFMLAANEAVAAHLEEHRNPSIYRIHEKPDPKRVMEFEEVAAHFGYSLGVGAIPVKKFVITERKRRDGSQSSARDRAAGREIAFRRRALSEAGGEDRGQAGGAHSQLPDAALAEAGALQRRERRPLRAGRDPLHALHVAHPALSRPDRAPLLRRRWTAGLIRRSRAEAPSPRSVRNPSAAPPMPSANWWSGRRSSSWRSAWARSSTR